MPIKLPKLQKRKSSGNVLEEIKNPPEPSFKVFDRPNSRAKSFDGGIALKIATQGPPRAQAKQARLVQEEELFPRSEPFNRGSNGTETSLSTAHHDSGASSLRLSSSSTNPSSIESRSDKNTPLPGQRPFNDIPVPPPPPSRSGFLKNTARTFSFGVPKGNKEPETLSTPPLPSLPLPYRPDGVGETRDRQVTSSSTSTATPPRLFDSDLALDNSELDGFGKMFDNFKLKTSRSASPNHVLASKELPSSPNYPSSAYREAISYQPPATLNASPFYNNSKRDNLESSPYSFVSQNSRDALLRSPSPPKPSVRSIASRYTGQSTRDGEGSDYLRRTATANTTTSTVSKVRSHSPGKNAQYKLGSPMSDSEGFVNDPSFVASATLAARYQDVKPYVPKMPVTNKIMTPAQFEQYKKQREMDRRLGIKSDESDDSDGGDDYEEEDEIERDKKAVKQRKKQEANLAVYRQTMMKVTGESNPARPASGMSNRQSSDELNRRVSRMTLDPRQSDTTPDEEEEDEDVPLGILAAHGFPNKNRPPTQLPGTRSFSPVAGLGPSQSAPALISESQTKTKLPVFARNLPQDPYYGAGLVNQSNRESLAFQGGAGPYMNSGASTPHPLHPAGLVGVIDSEEKGRAWRRGSPSAQGGYDLPPGMLHPGMMRSQTAPNLMHAAQPGMGPMLFPGDQAQMQMSQQMTQMMQMQMQWMEQMQQFMAAGQGVPPPGMYGPGMGPNGMMPPGMPPGMPLGMPSNGYLAPPQQMGQRPQSIHPGPAPSVSGSRTMSMMNPQIPTWNQPMMMDQPGMAGGYAPSIAPSERSNVGLASRYRPVSTAPAMDADLNSNSRRTSTFTSSTLRPFSQMGFGGSNRSITPVSMTGNTASSGMLGRKQPPIRPVDEDEDDEQAWAEMKAKKESKQRKWKLRKGQKTLEELYNA